MADFKTLKQLLSDEIQTVSELIMLIKQERQALEAFESQALADVTKVKAQKLAHLDALAKEKGAKLGLAGAAPNKANLQKWIKPLSKSEQESILSLWDKLKALLEQCKTENTINGKILIVSQNSVQKTLSIILQTPQDKTTTYTNEGKIAK